MPYRVAPEDEARHVPPVDAAADWAECLRIDVSGRTATARSRVAISAQVTLRPAQARVELLVEVREGGGSVVILHETDIELPPVRWEFRGHGVWIDHVVEEPLKRWSYGLEAFALEVDDLADFEARGLGIRVPLGWELDLDATSDPEQVSGDGWCGYRQSGRVDGILLGGAGNADQREVSGDATRSHWWGSGA